MFSNKDVIEKLKNNFVNVATDINYVQHQQDSEGKFFRKIAEQGHYAGRTKPTSTRQGLYVATADGNLLASINTTSAEQTLAMIDRALERWKSVDSSDVEKFAASNAPDRRFNLEFPEGGLILRETMRDLPRAGNSDHETWRHNFDHAWLTAEEMKSFVPANLKVGSKYKIPAETIRRLAAYHFVDQVRGEAAAWARAQVKMASLVAEVTKNRQGKIQIQLRGNAKCVQPASGQVNPYSKQKITKDRGVDLSISGWLEYDSASNSFERFDLMATGDRWGAATYNFRARDMGPAPIGFAFEMLPTKPENKTRPKFLLWDYFG